MKRRACLGFKVFAGALVVLGLLSGSCTAPERDFGHSSSGAGGAGGSGAQEASSSSSAASATSSSSAGPGTSSSGGMSKGCTSAMDMMLLNDMVTVNTDAQSCGQMCL